MIFAYLPWTKITFPLIVELVITLAYILSAMYFLRGAQYIRAEETHTREKVMYIRFLKADVDDCIAKAKSEELRAKLAAFSDAVRYSDPMSHPSLSGIEAELSVTVAQMAAKVGVAAVPGTSFFMEDVRDIVRLHYAKKDETLYAALERLATIKQKLG